MLVKFLIHRTLDGSLVNEFLKIETTGIWLRWDNMIQNEANLDGIKLLGCDCAQFTSVFFSTDSCRNIRCVTRLVLELGIFYFFHYVYLNCEQLKDSYHSVTSNFYAPSHSISWLISSK